MGDPDIKQLGETPSELSVRTIAVATNLIPWAGPFIAEAINEAVKTRQNRKLTEFLLTISQDLSTLKDLYDAGVLKYA